MSGENYSWLEHLINISLADDPDTLKALAAFSGKVMLLEFTGTQLRFYIVPGEHGLHLLRDCKADENVCIRGRVSDLFAYLMASRGINDSFSGNLEITGDIALAQKFQAVMKNHEFDWEEKLSRITGDLAARRVGLLLRSTGRFALDTARTLQADVSEYLRYEKQVLPDRYEVEEYNSMVKALAADVANLQHRVRKLQRAMRDG